MSKMGNGCLRRPLVVGVTSVTQRAPDNDTRTDAASDPCFNAKQPGS